jgi:hypothetical protein
MRQREAELPSITQQWLKDAISARWSKELKGGKPRLNYAKVEMKYHDREAPVRFTDFFAAVASHGGFEKVCLENTSLQSCSSMGIGGGGLPATSFRISCVKCPHT